MNYQEIEKANTEIKKQDIKGKMYAPVSERVLAFRKVYPSGSIVTEIIDHTDTSVSMKTTIMVDDKIIATGQASEVKKGLVNSTSMLENCETSSVGRALGFAGFGVDNGIASQEEIENDNKMKEENKRLEIYDKTYIPEYEAINFVKTAINILVRKQGIMLDELKIAVKEQCWTSLDNLNLEQLQILETYLAKVNNKTHIWHDLYNKNEKIKAVIPENQEIVYPSSQYMFGMKALEIYKDDELKKSMIIDSYMELGTDLTRKYE